MSDDVAAKVPGIEENGAAGDSLAIALASHDDARDQRLDAVGFVAAELAMRGIKPDNLPQGMSKEQWMIENIIPAWKRREPTLKFGYKAYKTFGAALASKTSWPLAGHWITGDRETDIRSVGNKRDCRGTALEKAKAQELFDTVPDELPFDETLSYKWVPD